jgi:serine/threonine-protein kinase HipA
MEKFPWFEETGKRMLLAWREGLLSLRMKNKYQLTYVVPTLEELGLSQPKSFEDKPKSIGKSELPRF